METTYKILAINPGSTSTKVAVFENNKQVLNKNVSHEAEKLKEFADVNQQLQYRKETIEQALEEAGIHLSEMDVFVGRGGGLVSVSGGTYAVCERLLQDARKGMAGQHPAQLAAQICHLYVKEYGGQAFIVNAPDVDEYDEISRVSGLTAINRESHIHALNQKEIALRYCESIGKKYAEVNLVICHIGGGISITAHRNGKMIDSNDILKGEGPMTPTRSGSLPVVDLMKLCYSGKYTEKEMKERLTKNGGLVDHLGTSDAREIEEQIRRGDEYAKLVYDAMIYQIGKEVGSRACALKGQVDAVLLTGGLANSSYVVEKLSQYISWIAPVKVLPGEFEMEALAAGALRVLQKEETPLVYTGKPVWNGFA